MAAEKRIVVETIANLKRALEQRDDGSESDDTIVGNSNRGRKLKRRAKFVHEGKLDDGKGVNGFKEEIVFHGRKKKIIYRKPNRRKRIAVGSDDEDEDDSENGDGSGSEGSDPYEGVDLTKLLAPLMSAADLPSHPSLAHIYTSRTLNELIQQALEKICEEKAHTVKLKNLLTKFLGDDPWINLGKMVWPTEPDHEAEAQARSESLLRQLTELRNHNSVGRVPASSTDPETNGKLSNGTLKATQNGVEDEDQEMMDVNGTTEDHQASSETEAGIEKSAEGEKIVAVREGPPTEGDENSKKSNIDAAEVLDEDAETRGATPPPEPHRMTTRSANNNNNNPTSPRAESEAPSIEVDPFFFPPDYSVDRDYGIPAAEAAETRRLLTQSVQRQDEFIRGLEKVRNGLLKAEKYRKKVWEWCRTMEGMREYHQHLAEVSGVPGNFDIDTASNVGLSDNEDWYDMEIWKLDEPLLKGQEEEDETDVAQQKKTRRRGDK
ncbi:RXT2-like protein [Pyronema omphalodes]|nr:RXT2-like protein [Pyronema omphalodes]